jgi:TPP-dependent pyruvate/acetoin dehydrogenase alpha subunit
MMTVRAICQPKPDLECGATAVEERRSRLGEQRTSRMERILRRVEEHVEEWRSRDAARHAEADAFRDMLWAEAAERERLLAEAMGEEEARCESIEELTKQHRVVFVLHREEVSETLEDFTSQGGDRLVSVVPRKGAKR